MTDDMEFVSLEECVESVPVIRCCMAKKRPMSSMLYDCYFEGTCPEIIRYDSNKFCRKELNRNYFGDHK